RRDRLHRARTADVEHDQRFGMRFRCAMRAPRRQLEVGAGARYRKKDAVVAFVIAEPADLRQTDAVAVERDELVEPPRVARDAQLDWSIQVGMVAVHGGLRWAARLGMSLREPASRS